MIKEKIIVPAGIRYISDWAKLENGYSLKNYPFCHILDKKLTGCGFTEYCLLNDQNIILCSPRKMLLENKAEQHWRDPNIIYFRNEVEDLGKFDIDLNSSPTNKGAVHTGLATQITTELREQEKQRQNGEIILELRRNFAENVKQVYKPGKGGCKILVTYDSFRHVKEVLTDLNLMNDFHVVIDEFQSIFVDSKFKSEAEIELLGHLSDLNRVCFVSATPMMDKYLEMLDEFKNLPYYELDWVTEDPLRLIKPEIDAKMCSSVIKEINSIIRDYQGGKFEKYSSRDDSGKIVEVESKEAVIYVNSVKHICSIIKYNSLSLENCNVLCARTPENEKKVRKAFHEAGYNFKPGEKAIGSVPTCGETHKMFTLCTRTVYLGADFYSTCARTFVVSDANLDSLSVDISLDLPQIMGRQRLDANPWKNRATLFFKSITGDNKKDAELFEQRIETKKVNTKTLLDVYTNLDDPFSKSTLAKKYEVAASASHYDSDYVSVNKHASGVLVPVPNNLVLVSEIRTFEIQQMNYCDRVSVFNELTDNRFSILYDEIEQKVKEFNELKWFTDKMALVCNTGFDEGTQQVFLKQIPITFGNYYNVLGPDKLRTLMYRNDNIKEAYNREISNQTIDIKSIIINEFVVGNRYPKAIIKEKLKRIYSEVGYEKTAKATDLLDYFSIRQCEITRSEDKTKRDSGFIILALKQ